MGINEIIGADDVLDALVGGFEVLMIQNGKTHRFGVMCIPLTGETFNRIEKYLDESDPNRIYIKTEKYVKADDVEES